MKLVVLPDAEAVAKDAARRMAEACHARAADGQRCSLMLAGGTTPKRAYELFAEEQLAWKNVHLYFGDERAVASHSPDSNLRMVSEALIDRVSLAAEQVHAMRGDAGDLDAAALEYERELPDMLDLIVLGMGQDGHTASLFPGSAALSETTRRVLPVIGPKPPPRRLSVTGLVLAQAAALLVLVTGTDKANVLREALTQETDIGRWPIQLALAGTFVIDESAASLLPAELIHSAREKL